MDRPILVPSITASRELAWSLVRRLRQLENGVFRRSADKYFKLWGPERFPFDLRRDTRIQIHFSEDCLKRFPSEGFLNQHQLRESGPAADFNPRERAVIEDRLLQWQLERQYNEDPKALVHYLRPKYGVLHIGPPAEKGPGPQDGAYTAVLKDEVKDRSTWTPGDSFRKWNASMDELRAFTFFFRPHGPLKSPPKDSFEVQIWGAVEISDVDYFIVPSGEHRAQL